MDEKDLYGTLGVPRGASEDEIRTAYRRLARETHPDVNPNDRKAEERFKDVAFAYDVLSDAEKKGRYDEFGMAGLEPGFDPEQARAYRRWSDGARRSPDFEFFGSDVDVDDLLGGLFGARHTRGPGRGADAEAEIAVEFLDAVRGGEVRLQVPGRGALGVRIPPGSDDGTRIRLRGQGGAAQAGGAAGDLYLRLRVRPHPHYTRSGADLRLELPVTVPELVLGAQVEVPTPYGAVSMKIPPGSQSGRVLRLRGKGATRRGAPEKGDLYVTLVAQLPGGDDPRLAEIARELEPLYEGEDVRRRVREESG